MKACVKCLKAAACCLAKQKNHSEIKVTTLSSLVCLSAEGTLLPPRALTADAAATLAAVRLQLPLSGERLRRARLLVARHLQAGRLRLRCRVWRHTLPGSAR